MPAPDSPSEDGNVLSLEEAKQRLEEASVLRDAAQAALDAATAAHWEARHAYDRAKGQQVEGRTLANLAVRLGNPTALKRLDEHAESLHEAITGVVYSPFGLRLDLPADVDSTFVGELASAMRDFVRTYKPYSVADQYDPYRRRGYAVAETRAGTLEFSLRRNAPAYLMPLAEVANEEQLDHFHRQLRRQERIESGVSPEETYLTLEEALTALPAATFLTSLSGVPVSRHFR